MNGRIKVIGLVAVSLMAAACFLGIPRAASSQALQKFEFAETGEVLGWTAAHDIAHMEPMQDGLRVAISGPDPYMFGPATELPANQPLWFQIRLKSDTGGEGQVFYFSQAPNEKNSVRFNCRPGIWEEIRVHLPSLGLGYRLRLDPPGNRGSCIISSIRILPRPLIEEPDWPMPEPPTPVNENLSLRSGDLRLVLATAQWNDFLIQVDGQPMGYGHTRPLIGVMDKGKPHWIEIGGQVSGGDAQRSGNAIVSVMRLTEPGGANWHIRQTYSVASVPGAIDIKTEVAVDQDRDVIYLPMLMVLAGAGSFGANKDHALFAGLEYLDKNEASSTEADIIGPGSHRQVPDSLKSTIPLMAVEAEGRYVGLAWTPDPALCAVFDSPDQRFKSGGHVMGILYPGSDGNNRAEGSLVPYEAQKLKAGQTLTLRATLLGGKGTSIVPAVQQFVAWNGAAPISKAEIGLQKYVDLAAAGWLASGIADGGKFRHIVGADSHPAADAVYLMDWLADKAQDDSLVRRLRTGREKALEQVEPGELNSARVGHVRYPLGALLYGHVNENLERARATGLQLLGRFTAEGTVLYRPPANGQDLARTHFARDANGLTAEVVTELLEAATECGDPDLIREGLQRLNALEKYRDSVPRGAQTWEVPLHTPDILASANLVRAFTLGYILTGTPRYLEQARYWAWTGVPFVYLRAPLTEQVRSETVAGGQTQERSETANESLVGAYATIPVYGATQWVAPNWMGLPVQWCGLVYADALYRLSRVDPNPFWKTLADGITVSGIQQTWPANSELQRRGLLPDSFNLRLQQRNSPAINPATVGVCATQLFTGAPLYDLHGFHANGLILAQAPGAITNAQDEADHIAFAVDGWPRHAYSILISGVKREPRVTIDGKPVSLGERYQYQAVEQRLILQVTGKVKIEVAL